MIHLHALVEVERRPAARAVHTHCRAFVVQCIEQPVGATTPESHAAHVNVGGAKMRLGRGSAAAIVDAFALRHIEITDDRLQLAQRHSAPSSRSQL